MYVRVLEFYLFSVKKLLWDEVREAFLSLKALLYCHPIAKEAAAGG